MRCTQEFGEAFSLGSVPQQIGPLIGLSDSPGRENLSDKKPNNRLFEFEVMLLWNSGKLTPLHSLPNFRPGFVAPVIIGPPREMLAINWLQVVGSRYGGESGLES